MICPHCSLIIADRFPILCICGAKVYKDGTYKPPVRREVSMFKCGNCLVRRLSKQGYQKTAGCPCEDTQRKMNAGGPKWCREHWTEIVASMVQEAQAQHVRIFGIEPPEIVLRTFAKKWLFESIRECEKLIRNQSTT